MRDILKSRKFIILSSSAILLVVLTTVLSVFLHCRMDSNNDFIVAGVSIGGIDVSSMTVEEARDKIEAVSYTHLDVYKRQGKSASALHSMKEKILHILVEIDASIDFPQYMKYFLLHTV